VSGSTLFIDIAHAAAPAATSTASPRSTAVAGKTYEVVPLKYADVSEVVGVLVEGQQIPPNDVFQEAGSRAHPRHASNLGGMVRPRRF
jgi:hypothetical protein